MVLLILAAGLSSRYGNLKQFDPIGPNGETIIELTIKDAIEVGFKKVIFIIRKEIEEEFIDKIINKIKDKIEVEYVYQSIEDIPSDIKNIDLSKRKKPWGTGQAILSAKEVINSSFVVINSDDYYGKESLKEVYKINSMNRNQDEYYMVGFKLENTLSKNGGVSRAICTLNENNILCDINEKYNIQIIDGNIQYNNNDNYVNVEKDMVVSMNMWIFSKDIFIELENQFEEFLLDNNKDKEREFLIPDVIKEIIKENKKIIRVITTEAKWCGITYKEDRESVVKKLKEIFKIKTYNL